MQSNSEYVYNRPSICYYVNLNTYTKGKFGNTNFTPPLSDPIEKRKVIFTMANYDSLIKPEDSCSHNTSNYISYAYFGGAYNKPVCQLCSTTDCK